MKSHIHKQFHAEKQLLKKTLKQLVQKKHQIRIHFLNNSTCHVRKLDPEQSPNPHQHIQKSNPQQSIPQQHCDPTIIDGARLDPKGIHSINHQEELFEVIYRNRNRMESIGWHEETPVKRTSNMSRTFRRRRRSNLEEYHAINGHNDGSGDESHSKMKNSHLAINTLELSGFTNQEILKKSAKTIEAAESAKNGRENGKYPHILTFIGDKNFKRVEFIPPAPQPARGVFCIAINKLNKKWKYEARTHQQAKSARQLINPELSSEKLSQSKTFAEFHHKKQNEVIQGGQMSQQLNEHPFLKQIKPSTNFERKKVHEKRAYSQFIRSRPSDINHYQSQRIQDFCRPWSVFRNIDEKLDEPKAIAQERFYL